MAAPSKALSRYDEFQAQTARITFTKVPNDVLEAMMHDELATYFERVMAWIWRYAWGNYSFYAINDDGSPRLQRDCVKELGIPKQAISKVVRYGIARGYLQEELKILYPLRSPVLTDCKKVAPVGDFSWATFIDLWKVANASDFLTWQVADATVKRIRKVAFVDYKRWRTEATNGGPSLYKKEEDYKEDEAGRQVEPAVVPESNGLPACPTLVSEGSENGNATPHVPTLEEIRSLPVVQQLEAEAHDTVGPKLGALTIANLRDTPLESFNERILKKRQRGPEPLGLLPNLAADAAAADDAGKLRAQKATQAGRQYMEEQDARTIADSLRKWDKLSETMRRELREWRPDVSWPPG